MRIVTFWDPLDYHELTNEMPGRVWTDDEKALLKSLVSQGLTARAIKREGYFASQSDVAKGFSRTAMSLQKQMQRMGLADPGRSSMVKADKAEAWKGKDRDACIRDLVAHWRETPVEEFAARWGVSSATIKYLLKQRGLGLSWREAIRLKRSPFRDPEKRRQWTATFRARAQGRREQRREALMKRAREWVHESQDAVGRRCVGCQHRFPLAAPFFRVTRNKGRSYFSHLCVVCSCERSGRHAENSENLMVQRNRDRLLGLRRRILEKSPGVEERICWKCSRSWPIDARFFKYSTSRASGKLLFEHVCRLCRAARRRELARAPSSKTT